MGRRTLTWHVERIRGDDGSQGPVFYADHDYSPGAVRLYARQAPNAGDLKVDIRDDGASILTSQYAALNKGGNLEEHAEDYPQAQPFIGEGSALSLHIISSGGAEDISAHLEMETVSDDDEDESE